jgi:uncharacterized protein YqgC (DUF456 family)
MLEIALWCLTGTLMFVGLTGVVLPLLPGTTLIFAAALLHKLILPASLSWVVVGLVGAFWLASVVSDFACVLLGTRVFGGSKWGMAGASGGALIGVFFSLPALLFGTIFGAVVAEKWLAKKDDRTALKAGLGAATGFAVATVIRLGCALVMIGLFLHAALGGAWR